MYYNSAATVIGWLVVFILCGILAQSMISQSREDARKLKVAPCSEFKEWQVKDLPVRCLKAYVNE